MSSVIVNNLLKSGRTIEPLTDGELEFEGSIFREYNNRFTDVLNWNVSVIDNPTNQRILIIIELYEIIDGNSSNPRKLIAWKSISNFPLTLRSGKFIVRLTTASKVKIRINLGERGYTQVKTLAFDAHDGEYATSELIVKRKRPPQICNEPLFYELIEGEMPPGLVLYQHDGLIKGVIGNMDCVEGDSPSFNWFYTNHDGHNQSWARMFRFKLRISLLNDSKIYDDQWFCIRVHNNWSYDLMKYEEAIQLSTETIQISGDTISLSPIAVIEEQQSPKYECLPCQDPTANYDEEIIELDPIYDFHFPFELVAWYKEFQMTNNVQAMKLSNARLFNEAINYVAKPNDRVKYEIYLRPDILKIKKYHLENRSFDDMDSLILASRNIENSIRDADVSTYDGEGMTAWIYF